MPPSLRLCPIPVRHQRQEELEPGSIGGIGVELDSGGKQCCLIKALKALSLAFSRRGLRPTSSTATRFRSRSASSAVRRPGWHRGDRDRARGAVVLTILAELGAPRCRRGRLGCQGFPSPVPPSAAPLCSRANTDRLMSSKIGDLLNKPTGPVLQRQHHGTL